MRLTEEGRTIVLPALTTAHSHAFQRAMRGRAQRPSATPGDFWSWRGTMYEIANALTPESIEAISRVAYRELYRAGVRTVGEFHYVHHQPDGTPYEDRTILAEAVIRAAKAEGLRIALLRVAYHRAGPGREPEPGQRRFCDADVGDVMKDVDALRVKYKYDKDVRIGVAPHSVRACPADWIRELARFSLDRALPFHMHVAEQPREIEECLAETGRRPIDFLANIDALSTRFVAVHATHLMPHEAMILGEARAFVCLCATTEADLGDGLPDLAALREAGTRFCTGVDSHVITDPLADLRALETLGRLRTQTRVTFTPEDGTPAAELWRAGSIEGAIACGFEDDGGTLRIPRDHPSLALVDDEHLLDAIVFGGPAALLEANSSR
ncbi:MAG: formimidoylglutamate deiminase [Labilithrix sp.]|nr:formimidoylglutamate deiminase [Labilithrix sp.]MCW5811947.1 formimidoylglutamate deiminase [Labilithrix sp.]